MCFFLEKIFCQFFYLIFSLFLQFFFFENPCFCLKVSADTLGKTDYRYRPILSADYRPINRQND